jgi:broad specificity phosphatase PhoE
LKDEKLPWKNEKESISELCWREREFIDWVKKRDEKNICVVSHSSFIGDLKDGVIGDEEHELKHCFPYKYDVR